MNNEYNNTKIFDLFKINDNKLYYGVPDGVMWKETDYHKQKELEKKNPIFKQGGKKWQ